MSWIARSILVSAAVEASGSASGAARASGLQNSPNDAIDSRRLTSIRSGLCVRSLRPSSVAAKTPRRGEAIRPGLAHVEFGPVDSVVEHALSAAPQQLFASAADRQNLSASRSVTRTARRHSAQRRSQMSRL